MWSSNWPENPTDGEHYWFYGDLWADFDRRKFSLAIAHKISNGFLFVADGQVMDKQQVIGFWMPCQLPSFPNVFEPPFLGYLIEKKVIA